MKDILIMILILLSLLCLTRSLQVERNIAAMLDKYGQQLQYLEVWQTVVNTELVKIEKQLNRD